MTELFKTPDLEDLWPLLKKGDSFVLKSAFDYFGLNLINSFSPILPNAENYGAVKETSSILEKISNLKPSQYGASILSPYNKHKLTSKSKRSHIKQKSARYEETNEGKGETFLVSEYRKYKKTTDRDGNLEVLPSNIHGLGLFTKIE